MLFKYAFLAVMRELISHPRTSYSVRDTAKKAGVSVFAAKYSLDELNLKKMITLTKIGNVYQYRANLESPLTRQWKITFSMEQLNDSKIVGRILKASPSILSILVYGSVAQGVDDEKSDLDILVISDSKSEGKHAIMACAEKTAKEPYILVYSMQEWKEKAQKDKVFYDNVIINSIVLYGEKPVVL